MPGHALPIQLTSFVGRDREVADLMALLTRARLVTLTGPGGSGKTRLASESARHWGGNVAAFVELAPIVDQALIANAVADALGTTEVPGEPLLETIVDSISSGQTLLVLDNCEHLTVGCALVVSRLLQDCPALTVLATSREPLNVSGEVVQRLQPLTPAAAATLFVERASAAEPGFADRPREPEVLQGICRQLDGLPLAIELAAPYTRFLSLKELTAQLSERFELLQARSPTAAARHQTLGALADWSYELLTAEEQRLYRRLSVFAAGCTLDALTGICFDDEQRAGGSLSPAGERRAGGGQAEAVGARSMAPLVVVQLLGSLVEKSLLITDEQEGETRYRMLETLRQHSRDKLRSAGEERDLRRRHLQWFRGLAQQAEDAWRGPHQDGWRQRIEHELENCRVALAWSRVEPDQRETALGLAAALVWPWRMNGHAGEAFDWLTILLSDAPPNLTRARGLRAAGWLAQRRAGPDAQPFLDEALSLTRTLEERPLLVAILRDLAFVRLERADPAGAQAAAQEGLVLAQAGEAIPWRYTLLRPLGLAAAALGRPEEAVTHLEDAARQARDQQDLYIASLALRDLGWLLLELGEPATARARLEECLELELPRRAMEAPTTLACLVALAVAQGDMVRAVRLAGAASRLRHTSPDGVRPLHLEHMERHLELASEALTPAQRDAAWTAGAAMSLDEAFVYALQSDGGDSVERPGGLTPRELEVARLLAGRLTNRQVAETLVISERTADRHVENILGKLHLSNRAEVAEWAAAHGLAAPTQE
jgi:predicted ATPase/DNA-binding NarL/FixJ family response regulator